MVKTVGLILFLAHVIGCNSAVLGYVIGTASNLTSDRLIRQLQPHTTKHEEHGRSEGNVATGNLEETR